MMPYNYRRENLTYGAAAAERPSIQANLGQLTERFKVLGFTIRPGSSEFYEVLLGTNPGALVEGGESLRTPQNFYASSEHSGLIRASENVYTVPAAVLDRFRSSERVYYSVIGYADANRAAPSQAAGEPGYVGLSEGFRSKPMAAILSIPLERLQRVRHDSVAPSPFSAPPAQISAEEDRAEGEDGYSIGASFAQEEWETGESDDYETRAYETRAYDSDGYEDTAFELDAPAGAESFAAEDGYDDGFGSSYGEPPAMLEDEDHERDSQDAEEPGYATTRASASDEDYDDGFGSLGASYASAGEEDDGHDSYDSAPPQSEAAGEAYGEPYGDEGDYARGESWAAGALNAPAAVITAPSARPLTIDDKLELIKHIAPFESGADGYAAINADGEFHGKFPGHPAIGKYHVGLSYGNFQYTQDSGSLGKLLTMMSNRDAAKFREVFGDQSGKLLEITNLPGARSKETTTGRSARVQPIGGADLWQEPWLGRFRRAAASDLFGKGRQLFNGAQNELAASSYLDPMLKFAGWLGLNTQRVLAMVFDRAVQMGPAAARRWIIDTVGPIRTPALRQQALAALGKPSIEAYQASQPDLKNDGDFGPFTHASLVSALRKIQSPIPIPSLPEMLEAMVRRGAEKRWGHRVKKLYESASLADAPFQI